MDRVEQSPGQARDGEAPWMEFSRQRAFDPRAYFAKLWKKGPVDIDEGEEGILQILDRADCEYVLKNWELFSSETTKVRDSMGSEKPIIPLNIDRPLQLEYRRLLDPLFTPKKMAALQPAVAAHTNDLIDSFVERGECDFSTDVSVPLPCSTFLSLLGLPQEELSKLVRWKDIMIRPEAIAEDPREAKQLQEDNAKEVYGRFAAEIAIRREKPSDDIIQFLMDAEMNGRKLTDDEIVRTCFLFMAAGLDTVTISLQCIFAYLAQHPEAQRMLVDEPETQHAAIEELLRWETPVQHVLRIATADTEVSGYPIKKGQLIHVMLASANIDPKVKDASEVDLRRRDKRHITFGGGPHRCLGSHLARMELRTVVAEWHRRIPDYRVKPGSVLEWNGSSLRGIDSLPLVWSPDAEVNRR
jgi:cytochrome P450